MSDLSFEEQPVVEMYADGRIIMRPVDVSELTVETTNHGPVRVAVNETAKKEADRVWNERRKKQLKKWNIDLMEFSRIDEEGVHSWDDPETGECFMITKNPEYVEPFSVNQQDILRMSGLSKSIKIVEADEEKAPSYLEKELVSFGLTSHFINFLVHLHNRSNIRRPELGDSRREVDMNKVTLETVRNILRATYAVNADSSLDEYHANEIKAQIRSTAIRHAKAYAKKINYDL